MNNVVKVQHKNVHIMVWVHTASVHDVQSTVAKVARTAFVEKFGLGQKY